MLLQFRWCHYVTYALNALNQNSYIIDTSFSAWRDMGGTIVCMMLQIRGVSQCVIVEKVALNPNYYIVTTL